MMPISIDPTIFVGLGEIKGLCLKRQTPAGDYVTAAASIQSFSGQEGVSRTASHEMGHKYVCK